jgi:hypothetical protein
MAAVLATSTVSLAAIARERTRFEIPAASAAVRGPAADRSGATVPGTNGVLPEVMAAVEAARRGGPIPVGLTPPIGQLRNFGAPYAPPDGCISKDSSSDTTSKVCRIGASASAKLVVLFGDSHAMMWLPALLETAWRDGWAVVPLLRTGCTPQKWRPGGGDAPCREWYAWALRQVGRLHPRATLLGGSIGELDTPSARAATDGVTEAAAALKRLGRVVVIGDPEGLTVNPVDCLLSGHASMASCTTTWPAASLRAYDRVAARTKALGVGFLATRGFLCFERRCPAVIGHTIAYMDNNHMTVAYSARIGGAFGAAFRRLVPAGG